MTLTPETVEKISLLARLRLTAEDLEKMTAEMDQIVHYVDQLASLDTDQVEPMAHAVELQNVFAEDTVRPSLDRAQIMANAPQRDEECYRVPAVLGE
ncbi:MAG: Asp-tRNA(Asn)/Glu-tRNA(Gln) amidotransferase subunit GatC [Planctomycetales bacterium]|nr:Asp-tRNA(Asn)/Glu-tRNA(Gln) amidotransferase subunit GatC [Planctomycetales bacterium]